VSKGVFELLLERAGRLRTAGATISEVPALTPEDDLTLKGLARVMREYTDLPRHAALRMGEVVTPFTNRESARVSIQVLKPCKRGLPLSTVTFRGRSVAEAAHEAKRFVESILPCDAPDGS
jgi:hypothetical protein